MILCVGNSREKERGGTNTELLCDSLRRIKKTQNFPHVIKQEISVHAASEEATNIRKNTLPSQFVKNNNASETIIISMQRTASKNIELLKTW